MKSVESLVRERVRRDRLDNTLTRTGPGVLDMVSGNLGCAAGVAGPRSSSLGPIPFQEIGLYTDELRANLPPLTRRGE